MVKSILKFTPALIAVMISIIGHVIDYPALAKNGLEAAGLLILFGIFWTVSGE